MWHIMYCDILQMLPKLYPPYFSLSIATVMKLSNLWETHYVARVGKLAFTCIRYMTENLALWQPRNGTYSLLFFLFLLLVFPRQGFSVKLWLSRNSLCRPGWPGTQRSACLCLPSAGIKSVRHHYPAKSWHSNRSANKTLIWDSWKMIAAGFRAQSHRQLPNMVKAALSYVRFCHTHTHHT